MLCLRVNRPAERTPSCVPRDPRSWVDGLGGKLVRATHSPRCVVCTVATSCSELRLSFSMGRKREAGKKRIVRDDELDFIEACTQLPVVQDWLNKPKKIAEASRYITSAYLADPVMSKPLRGETEQEFKTRKRTRKTAMQLVAESEEQCRDRLDDIGRVRHTSCEGYTLLTIHSLLTRR